MEKVTLILLPTRLLTVSTIGAANAVTSFDIKDNCAETGHVYRVNKADNLSWLATFGVIP